MSQPQHKHTVRGSHTLTLAALLLLVSAAHAQLTVLWRVSNSSSLHALNAKDQLSCGHDYKECAVNV